MHSASGRLAVTCFCRNPSRSSDGLDSVELLRIPLEDLHADAAAQLREYDHIAVLPVLNDERRAWQAWVRLTRVFRLKHVAILSQQ